MRGKRSEGRLRTSLPWPRLRLPSSLWKTLRSLAPQGRAPINANTGVWANGRGVRGKEKGQEASADLGSPLQPETRTPSEGGRPQAFTAPTALGSEHRRQEFQGWGVSPGEDGCRLSRAPSDHLVMPGCGIHWPAELLSGLVPLRHTPKTNAVVGGDDAGQSLPKPLHLMRMETTFENAPLQAFAIAF